MSCIRERIESARADAFDKLHTEALEELERSDVREALEETHPYIADRVANAFW